LNDGETRDFVRSPWRMRAIMQKGVLNEDEGHVEDMIVWFISLETRDEWFAHGLTSEADETHADAMAQTIDPAMMTAMLALAGQRWSIIKALPIQHARSQRDVLAGLTPEQMLIIVGMNRETILQLRSEGEGPRFPSMN
jgi:hypothetical protein